MEKDFERTSIIEAGHWYTFNYDNINEYKVRCDAFPVIFCFGDTINNPNVFCGVNIHRMSKGERRALFDEMQAIVGESTDDRSAWPFTLTWFKSHAGMGLTDALRFYNRKNVREPYKIKSTAVKYYLGYDGSPIGCDREALQNDHELERNENT